MSWDKQKASTMDIAVYDILKPENHISNASENELFEIYGCSKSEDEEGLGIGEEYVISRWNTGEYDDRGKPLDLIVYKNGEKLYWEPSVEQSFRQKFLNGTIKEYQFGYIDGRVSHLGALNTWRTSPSSDALHYIMWQKKK